MATISTAKANDNKQTSVLSRYQINNFKRNNAKRVPHEQLDFTIYKANSNSVAFSTTEERLPLWIRALKLRYKHGLTETSAMRTTWEEEDNTTDKTKCDKVTVLLINNKSDETLLTITATKSHTV